MKHLILLTLLLFSTFYSISKVVTTKGDKVEVRDINGKFIANAYYSNMSDAIAGDNFLKGKE